jgi:hypothetical protein
VRRTRRLVLIAGALVGVAAAITIITVGATGNVSGHDCGAVYASIRTDTESPVVQAGAARTYARDNHVTVKIAYARLRVQDATSPLLGAITAALGPRWAGAWYDANDCGRLKVAVASSDRRLVGKDVEAARSVLRNHRLITAVRLVPVRSSLTQLEWAQTVVDRELRGLLSSGKIETYINVPTNGVIVSVATSASRRDRRAVRAAAASVSVSVVIERSNQAQFCLVYLSLPPITKCG